MALKRKITKEKFDKLSDELKKEYVEQDGDYVLDVEGFEDVGALKRAKSRESEDRKTAQAELKAAKEKLAELEKTENLKNADVHKLQKAWDDERETITNEHNQRLLAKDKFIKKTLKENASIEFSTGTFKNPTRDSIYLEKRFDVDMTGDEPKLIILDAKGKPSKMTKDDLKKEFIDNPNFSDIIVGSNASGSGASNDGKTTQRAPSGSFSSDKPMRLADMTSAQRLEIQKSNQK